MKPRFTSLQKVIRILPLIFLVLSLPMPFAAPVQAETVQVTIEDPQLHPAYTTCVESFWYQFDNNRSHKAYLTLNVHDPADSTNSGEWHPAIPQTGYYRVEAYIPTHGPITWCSSGRIKEHDTTNARYTIHHAYGETSVAKSQYPLSNQWLNLGEFYFNAGSAGYVSLVDLNGETEFTTTVSFSAMRFTFTRTSRVGAFLPAIKNSTSHPPADVGILQAQGFDACHLPTTAEMQTWWNQSPYAFYALYLGGISSPSVCSGLTSSWVHTVHQQGWSFVPVWVGPQAPCSVWSHKMSADPATSYQQGRQEADAASTRAQAVGLTTSGLGGTVIYYDMEVFGGATLACRQAASAFINGWVKRLHELGNVAGGYGAHNSYVEDWVTINNVPNEVWAASWYTNTYDASASVFGISWLNGLWTSHQRLRQYTGSHYERWGTINLNIDTDVADGMVAMPPSRPFNIPIVNMAPGIEDSGWLAAEEGWLISGNKLYWTNDKGDHWSDISPAPVQVAYFLPGGQAWALSTLEENRAKLYLSTNTGTTWESLNLSLPPDEWRPLQMQFITPTSGWMVLQKETSQAFSYGILLRTRDGGRTWLTYDLPMAAPIIFLSEFDGWMISENRDTVYHSTDGGVTWQHVDLNEYPLSVLHAPGDAIQFGWQVNGLGWAVTSTNTCTGTKGDRDFTCQSSNTLWHSMNGGQSWEEVALP